MPRNIYITDVSNEITKYHYSVDSDWNELTLYSSIELQSFEDIGELWFSDDPQLTGANPPYKSTGFCTLGEGVDGTYMDTLLCFLNFPIGDTNKYITSNWITRGFNVSSYTTFTNDIAAHLSRASNIYHTINALVFYNVHIQSLKKWDTQGLNYPSNDVVSGFWAYCGNDPEAGRVIRI